MSVRGCERLCVSLDARTCRKVDSVFINAEETEIREERRVGAAGECDETGRRAAKTPHTHSPSRFHLTANLTELTLGDDLPVQTQFDSIPQKA